VTKHPLYLTIHGHFYQPPRENPWTGEIELQESAQPDHDWNDRIAKQCYTPNSASRILGSYGRIQDIVNNYEYMSFNMGPTLLNWIRRNTPHTYKRIQQADQNSAKRLNGHGNAVAQVFNHMIMPLANRQDRITQIRWGIQDFAFHFGRKPEAMWLAETAVNMDTIVDLIDEGIQFIILSPTQAQSYRPILPDAHPANIAALREHLVAKYGAQAHKSKHNRADDGVNYEMDAAVQEAVEEAIRKVQESGESLVSLEPLAEGAKPNRWLGCEHTDIDTTRPYRIIPRDENGRRLRTGHIDVFFYDAGLSSAVGFEHLLRDAKTFTNRILGAFNAERQDPQLINIGTDGESYGHHEPYGDMCAAYLYSRSCTQHDILPVNYGWYLESFPPEYEVSLKNWHSEGSAWSCAHGVGRWYRDCGCSTGAPEGWDQKWRGPLREAFDSIQKVANDIFVRELTQLGIQDPWALRNEYGKVVIQSENHENRVQWLLEHTGLDISSSQGSTVVRLLEAQKFCMYSFTSCGWFFNDIQGLEPVQNMRYALRAMELIKPWVPDYAAFNTQVLAVLHKAVSNIDGSHGDELFIKQAVEAIPVPVKVAAGYGVAAYLDYEPQQLNQHSYAVQITPALPQAAQSTFLQGGYLVELLQKETAEQLSATVYVAMSAEKKLLLAVTMQTNKDFLQKASLLNDAESLQLLAKEQNGYFCTLDNLIIDTRNALAEMTSDKANPELEKVLSTFLYEHKLSGDFLGAGASYLGNSLFTALSLHCLFDLKAVLRQILSKADLDKIIEAKRLYQMLKSHGIGVSMRGFGQAFYERIAQLLQQIIAGTEGISGQTVRELTELITLADMLHLDIQRNELENMCLPAYKDYQKAVRALAPNAAKIADQATPKLRQMQPVFEWLNFEI
jgi:hypothetical protein